MTGGRRMTGTGAAKHAGSTEPRLYGELASWWPLLSAPADYAEEAALFARIFRELSLRRPRTLLELGCGGGNNASHLKAQFDMTLTDRSRAMLAVSRALNPECEHVRGDMRDLRLERTFDGVFIHDAVMYMTTKDDLRRALETAFVHCRPGGALVVVPDHVRESFRPSTSCGGHDGTDRALRYLEWTWDPDPEDDTYLVDFAFLVREKDQPPEAFNDRHVLGIFGEAIWLDLMAEAGFETRMLPFLHSDPEAAQRGRVFAGVRRGGSGGLEGKETEAT